jgi:hypothetical protein
MTGGDVAVVHRSLVSIYNRNMSVSKRTKKRGELTKYPNIFHNRPGPYSSSPVPMSYMKPLKSK